MIIIQCITRNTRAVWALILAWIYYASLEASPWQATLGKKAMGIRVVDRDGMRCSFGRTSLRLFSKIFLSGLLTLGVGYLFAAFTEKKQALHDLLADTFCEKL